MTERNKHFSAPAVGLFLIIIMLGRDASTGSVLYRLTMGVAYPALFVLMGYNMHFPKNGKQFIKRTAEEALTLLVPSYVSYFCIQLYTYANKNWGDAAYWNVYMDYMRDTFRYSAPRSYGDIPSIGIAWILISIFFTRLIINGVWIAVHAIYVNNKSSVKISEKTVTKVIYIVVGLVGMVLLHHYIILPLNLSAVFLLVLITTVGIIWKENIGKLNAKWQYLAISIMTIVGLIALAGNKLMDVGGMSFPGQLISVILSLSCIIPAIYLARIISKIRFIRDGLTLMAKYSTEIIISFELSSIYSVLWAVDNEKISDIINIICTIALALITVQIIHTIKNKSPYYIQNDRTNIYYKAIIITYYIAVLIAYISAAMEYGALTKILPSGLTSTLIALSTSVLLLLYSTALPRYRSFAFSILMTSLVAISLCQTIIMHNESSIFTLTLLAGTSIFATTHIIGKIIWLTESIFVFIMYILSMNGYVLYSVISTGTGDLTGHSFGILGKNELAALLLSMSIAYCMGRKSNKRYWLIADVMVIGFNAFINKRYVGGRSDFTLTVLLLLGTVVYRMLGEETLRIRVLNKISEIIHCVIGIPIYIIIMIACVVMSWIYDGVHAPFANIISRFTDITTYAARLWLSKTALLVYKPKFWGQYIYEDATTTSTQGAGYFWIDCSYVRILLMYGVAVTCILLIILTYTQYKNARQENYYFVMLGIIVALMGIMGHRIPQYLFNPMPAVMLADCFIEEQKRNSTKEAPQNTYSLHQA